MLAAKIMLIGILLFSLIAGALAFKVQNIGNSSYCYLKTEQVPAIGSCTNTAVDKTARPMGDSEDFVFYQVTSVATPQSCALANCSYLGVPDMQ
jgi:hypothetical protein